MVIVSKSLRTGEPLSVTRSVTVFVLGPWSSVGVQVKVRVEASKVAPVGAPASMLYTRVWAGRSESRSEERSEGEDCTLTLWLPMAASTGGLLDTVTT